MEAEDEVLLKTLNFRFKIKFEELSFSRKYDLVAKAAPMTHNCVLYLASWLGMRVALRKFSDKELVISKKLKTDFFKELEVAHNLRHPNILLYMGLSRDPSSNTYYIVQEFVSHITLYDVLHGVRKPIR